MRNEFWNKSIVEIISASISQINLSTGTIKLSKQSIATCTSLNAHGELSILFPCKNKLIIAIKTGSVEASRSGRKSRTPV